MRPLQEKDSGEKRNPVFLHTAAHSTSVLIEMQWSASVSGSEVDRFVCFTVKVGQLHHSAKKPFCARSQYWEVVVVMVVVRDGDGGDWFWTQPVPLGVCLPKLVASSPPCHSLNTQLDPSRRPGTKGDRLLFPKNPLLKANSGRGEEIAWGLFIHGALNVTHTHTLLSLVHDDALWCVYVLPRGSCNLDVKCEGELNGLLHDCRKEREIKNKPISWLLSWFIPARLQTRCLPSTWIRPPSANTGASEWYTY